MDKNTIIQHKTENYRLENRVYINREQIKVFYPKIAIETKNKIKNTWG